MTSWLRSSGVASGRLDPLRVAVSLVMGRLRRVLPPIGGGGMAIDISPILAIILLFVAQAVVVGLIAG